VFSGDYRSPVTQTLTQRYIDAGFVICGKTNTPELGILPTTEPQRFGPTRNPWNTGHSTGGSSGGSAAPSRPGWCRPPMPTTAGAPFAFRLRAADWSA